MKLAIFAFLAICLSYSGYGYPSIVVAEESRALYSLDGESLKPLGDQTNGSYSKTQMEIHTLPRSSRRVGRTSVKPKRRGLARKSRKSDSHRSGGSSRASRRIGSRRSCSGH